MNPAPITDFQSLVFFFIDLIMTALPVVASLALLAFVWGLAKFIFAVGGDEKAVGEGKNLMKWGLVALFVMVSLRGLLAFASNEFGFTFGLPLLPTN